MPELPEVETVRRGLEPVLTGRTLRDVVVRRPDLRFPLPEDFAGRLRGRAVVSVARRAKFLLIHLDDGMVWLAHLGMSGRFRIGESDGTAPDPHEHVVVSTDDGIGIRFHDPRRFGFMDLIGESDLASHPRLASLCPEPLGEDFSAAHLAGHFAGRAAPIKAVLLDQGAVAGMGNIYASESLFRARVSPCLAAARLTPARIERLTGAITATFREAIAAGGSTLRDHRLPSGELGTFQNTFAVYGREGLPCPGCRCDLAAGGGISRIVQSGRSTFYCRQRQR